MFVQRDVEPIPPGTKVTLCSAAGANPGLVSEEKKKQWENKLHPTAAEVAGGCQESTSSSDESPPKLLILLCWSLALSRSRSQHTCVCALLLGLARRPWQEVT